MENLQISSEDEADEIWLEEEGVPSLEEPFLQRYLDGRDALVAQEKRQRSDHAFRETRSPMAAEASAIISAIRFEEQQTLWNPQYEDNLAKQENASLHPGMMYTLAKQRMESSKLWKIVQKMPKGALLHCHMEAIGDLDWLIDEVFRTEGICISASGPLVDENARQSESIKFQYVKAKSEASSSMWESRYAPDTFIAIDQAAQSFPGGKDAFVHWLKSRVTITPEEALQYQGPDQVWNKFRSCFPILASLHMYEPIFRKYIRRFLTELNNDGVKWVDLRSAAFTPFWPEGAETPDTGYEAVLEALQEEINAFVSSPEGQGFWGARVIWSTLRDKNKRGIIESMKACIALKQRFPDLIAGYDLVGQEDLGRPLVDLTPELFWFKKRCKEEDVDIPFYFHAGETLGDGDVTDENLFDAVLLGTRRIGHGFSLYKHPLLIEMIKEKKILVESCPISNEILRLTGSITQHPLPALLSRGVACCLSNDDPLIFGQGTSGVSNDFWQALQGWENLGLEGLASLAENSVRWATFDDCTTKEWQADIKASAYGSGVRAKRLKEWARDFEKFCQWVVLEYGAETDINTLD